MPTKYLVAACQMDSQNDKRRNLQIAEEMIAENAAKGAKIIAFPETVNYMGIGYHHQAEPIPGETTEFFCRAAKKYQTWIVTGSFPEKNRNGKPYNTLLCIDPHGSIHCKYRKLHMFDVEVENTPSYKESDHNSAGNELVLADTELGCFGFAICYDLRFGEMFRLMTLEGAKVIFLPSSFTLNTGKDHWEALIRARAIENGVYIVAPNQIGKKTNMIAYGKSMIVDPWGDVIARAGEHTGSILAEIDLDYLENVRRQIPVLENRLEDMYETVGKMI